MTTMCAEEVKKHARELGADLCGIASIDRFADAPVGFHPADIVPACKSVIVTAVRFPLSTLRSSSPAAYTFVRNKLVEKVDTLTFQLAADLENLGSCAVPIPSAGPYEFWDETRRHGQGILSLKHAAVQAGLGKMGKNTLLVNDQLGNMLWLGAILVDAGLTADMPADYETCAPDCRLCLDSCPAQALNGSTIVQSKCRSVSAKSTDGGGAVYMCNLCRKLCPNHNGIS